MSRTLPHSVEAEESVVGMPLVHPVVFDQAAGTLIPEDFYHPALRAIYEAELELKRQSKPIDALTVAEQMKAMALYDRLHAFGGEAYLADLMSKVVTVENISYHAGIVKAKADARRLIAACSEIAARGYRDDDTTVYLTEAEQQLLQLFRDRAQQGGPLHIKPFMRQFLEQLGERVKLRKEGHRLVGIPTGYADVDDILSGLRNGSVYVVGGRPGQGKTSLVMNVLTNVTYQPPRPEGAEKLPPEVAALLFSHEMTALDCVEKMISSDGRVDSERLARGDMDGVRSWSMVTNSMSRLVEQPFYIDERGGMSIIQIQSTARRWRAKEARDAKNVVIAIDYLQLLKGTRATDARNYNRVQEIGEITRGIKELAKELNCPIIVISALNRSLESRQDKRPQMSDLRESGDIESDADVVMFVHREESYCADCKAKKDCNEDHAGIAEVTVAKNRRGRDGIAKLAWLGTYTRFETLSPRRDG